MRKRQRVADSMCTVHLRFDRNTRKKKCFARMHKPYISLTIRYIVLLSIHIVIVVVK